MVKETAMEPHSLKLTIKLKSEKSVEDSLTTTDPPSYAGGKPSASNSYCTGSLAAISQDPVDFSGAGGLENDSRQGEENPSENSQHALVLCDPSANDSGEAEIPDPISDRRLSSQRHPRGLPSVGAFTVQCANCFKWRLIPTQEKYEEIREHIIEQPFLCEKGREWRPDISCDDPPDLMQDGSRLWAIDKPSIARPPPGWQRLLKFRGEGSSKFADVYYVAPSGKRLRSVVEIQRYLEEHPEYKEQCISLSRFSFQIPRPLQDNYVRKRPLRAAPTSDAENLGMEDVRASPASNADNLGMEVEPISWVNPDVDGDLQLSRTGRSTDHSESPDLKPETQSAKKRKAQSKKRVKKNFVHNPVNLKREEVDQHCSGS